jgi:hypothetical protein
MKTEEIRKGFMPSNVSVLMVAESPPDSGKFFYVDSGMTKFTSRAFEKAYVLKFNGSADFLEYFRDCGCYLDDLTETPVNKLPDAVREQLIISGVDALAERIRQMRPKVVVTVLRKIKRYVDQAIKKSGVETKNFVTPFPGNGHQNKYIDALAEILTQHIPAKPKR